MDETILYTVFTFPPPDNAANSHIDPPPHNVGISREASVVAVRPMRQAGCEYLGAKGTYGCKGMSGTKKINSLEPHMYIPFRVVD